LSIAGFIKWHDGFKEEADYGDWLLYDNIKQKAPTSL